MLIALAIILGLTLVFFALVGAPHLFRGTPVDRVVGLGLEPAVCTVEMPEFPHVVNLAARCLLATGNSIELLENGERLFPRLWSDLAAAKRSITLTSYYAKPGAVADRLADILCERARAGVPVYWTWDAVGSGPLPTAYWSRLREAGVRTAAFRPVRWYALDRANNRTHVRSIVIDGSVGYTGGFGFDDLWQGDGVHEDCWRDTSVRVMGPAVAELQSAFVAHWGEAANELLADTRLMPSDVGSMPADPAHAVDLAGVMISPATAGSSNAERTIALAIGASCRTLVITNAYVVPDDEFVDMLCAAQDRGVDVRLLTNGEKGDVPMTRLAGRRRYDRLLRAGVRIFEYQPTVLHSKTFVADGLWSAVGSVNFDNRSLTFNGEISTLILDRAFAARLEASFQRDLENARELTLRVFRNRPVRERVLEVVADAVWRWL